MDEAKPFKIPKREVWDAFRSVKANQGAAGVDGQSIAEFEADLTNNLYKLWNRLSSGSYFPPPVRRVDIPKADGRGVRRLGIPTVADRIAQEVARRYLEPILEPVFHPDSYGYRPGKSAIDAVHTARQRCWRYDWVLDLDPLTKSAASPLPSARPVYPCMGRILSRGCRKGPIHFFVPQFLCSTWQPFLRPDPPHPASPARAGTVKAGAACRRPTRRAWALTAPSTTAHLLWSG